MSEPVPGTDAAPEDQDAPVADNTSGGGPHGESPEGEGSAAKSPAIDGPDAQSSSPRSPATNGIDTGTYDLLARRLAEQAKRLTTATDALNARRVDAYGGTELELRTTVRVRTDNNCVPRDIVSVGDTLLFGYNVFIGLRTETAVEDVFALRRRVQPNDSDEGSPTDFALEPLAADDPDNLLADQRFRADFAELYRYYKETRLLGLRRNEHELLAAFQTSATAVDLKVFRWAIAPASTSDGTSGVTVRYVDNRGERAWTEPPLHDVEWTATTREDHVTGRYPHINIDDTLFVETVGGDLTIKVEDNTETGTGVYQEPVIEATQGLADAEIDWVRIGSLLLVRVLPYKEEQWRYLVFNTRTRTVKRLDALGNGFRQLPDDAGLVFAGGIVLRTGVVRTFDTDATGIRFREAISAPNGEDVLYVFHDQVNGRSLLLPYSVITTDVPQLLDCHGYGVFDDGALVIFRATSDEPTRIHPMQVWASPFCSEAYADTVPDGDDYLALIGNAELVRGIGELYALNRMVDDVSPTVAVYDDLRRAAKRLPDAFHWMTNGEVAEIGEVVAEIGETAAQITDEFAKVLELRSAAADAVEEATAELGSLVRELDSTDLRSIEAHVEALRRLRVMRGHLVSLRERRYVDTDRLDQADTTAANRFETLSQSTVEFLMADDAFTGFTSRVASLADRASMIETAVDADALAEEVQAEADGLDLLSGVVDGLSIDDATKRTSVLHSIAEVMASLNRARALLENRRSELRNHEAEAEFGAQFALVSQAVTSGLAVADTPDACDEQLGKLLLSIEGLESRFADVDAALEQLITKREDVVEAFAARKQSLLDDRQRQAERLAGAADRVLGSVARRTATLDSLDEVNAYFIGDPTVARFRDLADQLRELGEGVRADELDGRLKAAREDAGRSLRDRADIFEGGDVVRLGRHRFTVSSSVPELTVVPGDEHLNLVLTGTDYRERLDDPELAGTEPYWSQSLVSETSQVARAEYLATSILGSEPQAHLMELVVADDLSAFVAAEAAQRYAEGYERGVHDHDATLILTELVKLSATAGLLAFPPRPRALAVLFWARATGDAWDATKAQWRVRAASLARLAGTFARPRGGVPADQPSAVTAPADGAEPSGSAAEPSALDDLQREVAEAVGGFLAEHRISVHRDDADALGRYLCAELGEGTPAFAVSTQAERLASAFLAHLTGASNKRTFDDDLAALTDLGDAWRLATAWLTAFIDTAPNDPSAPDDLAPLAPEVDEAAVAILTANDRIEREPSSALGHATVTGLLSQHPRIVSGSLDVRLDEILHRTRTFAQHRVPGFRAYQATRDRVLTAKRNELRLDEFEPKVMSAFVRNRLLDEVYLPLIGENLAKQLGAAGDDRRTDQMGLLLLISPPGYGKTTLMEYVANRLGLIFVKVNGPALGHGVTSLDPAEAPNATARQEVDKINLALELGNNVLLYLDDIQHTNAELLQKFISLCDAQRRMEGVWHGRTRTYDLKGKRFAVCMAGNPYTSAGERFRVPDMLANRADVWNLGDVLSGRDELFALSYIENSLTSNPVLAPVAGRDRADIAVLVARARAAAAGTTPSGTDELNHPYGAAELEEITSVLTSLVRAQEVVLAVNQAYIASAAQADEFRTEPPFQLQGSYRNLNKLAERIVPGMNDAELESLIDDHYAGEAQTLTSGAEANVLKLAELRGAATPEQRERWESIKATFVRTQRVGSADDPMAQMSNQLGLIAEALGDRPLNS